MNKMRFRGDREKSQETILFSEKFQEGQIFGVFDKILGKELNK